MKTLITLCYNPETDDLFAAIIQDGRCFCYGYIGQHSQIAESYLRASDAAKITEDGIDLWNEVKSVYSGFEPTLIDYLEFISIIDNEQIKFKL